MKYLFDEWGKIKKSLAGKNIFLFLDYDGTLASIADHPSKAFLSAEIKKSLNKIILNPGFKVAVISGRSLPDIKSRVGIKEIIYSGNHGLEIESPEFKYRNEIGYSYKILLGKIKEEMGHALADFKGVYIEDKKLSLTVHYRLAYKKQIAKIKSIIYKTVEAYVAAKKIKIRNGKMVVEILPPVDWNKGLAVSWILHRPEFSDKDFYPIYIGDDITDEDAFKMVKQ